MPAVAVRSSPKGFPIATTGSPTSTASESASARGVSAVASASTSRSARSVDGIGADDSGRHGVLVREADLDLRRAVDDVEVRDDVAVLVEDESGAERLLLLPRHRIAEGVGARRSRSRWR